MVLSINLGFIVVRLHPLAIAYGNSSYAKIQKIVCFKYLPEINEVSLGLALISASNRLLPPF